MVLEAKGLICPFNVESLDTFVRIYLVPDEAAAMQTKVSAGCMVVIVATFIFVKESSI